MDFFGHSSSLKNFAFLIVALVIVDRHSRVDGLVLCNCSNPGRMFDVDPRAMVLLPSVDLQDQLESNFNASLDDLTTLINSDSMNITMSAIIHGYSTAPPIDNSTLILLDDLSGNGTQNNFTISSPENSTLMFMDHLPENVTQQFHLMNASSDLQLNDDIAFASFDALVGDLLNFTSNASEAVSSSVSLSSPSSRTAMMIDETTTQAITDFILDDFTSSSTGMSASEDDLSFAAFDSIDGQASNMNSYNQSNITLIILSDDLSDFDFDASNFSTSDEENLTNSTIMSHTGKKKSSESSESSSTETSTLPDVLNNMTDSVMIDALDNMNNTNTTSAIMSDDLSDSGESSDLAITVTTSSAIDSKSQENAEAGSTTSAKDSSRDISSKKSSESSESESAEIESKSAEHSSSPKPTAKSRKPPTSLVPAFNCQGKEDGPYANPYRKCSHYFYLCADDEYFVQFCPANMYYDKTRFLCDGFDNVFDCSGVRHTRPLATAKTTTASPAINFDCTERDDGDYEVLSCIEHFVTCFSGKAIPRICSPGLLFDDNVKQCEFPKYILKCGGHVRTTTPTTAAAPDDVPATTVTYTFNCERRQDGAHADPDTPCSRHFFMCSSGRTFYLKCPDNLFFNRNSTECDYRKSVVECKKLTKLPLITRQTV